MPQRAERSISTPSHTGYLAEHLVTSKPQLCEGVKAKKGDKHANCQCVGETGGAEKRPVDSLDRYGPHRYGKSVVRTAIRLQKAPAELVIYQVRI
jgi:hypothetical protein